MRTLFNLKAFFKKTKPYCLTFLGLSFLWTKSLLPLIKKKNLDNSFQEHRHKRVFATYRV